jgi:hypothetical protein
MQNKKLSMFFVNPLPFDFGRLNRRFSNAISRTSRKINFTINNFKIIWISTGNLTVCNRARSVTAELGGIAFRIQFK